MCALQSSLGLMLQTCQIKDIYRDIRRLLNAVHWQNKNKTGVNDVTGTTMTGTWSQDGAFHARVDFRVYWLYWVEMKWLK